MIAKAKELGRYAIFIQRWSDADRRRVAEIILKLTRDAGLIPVLALNPVKPSTGTVELDMPDAVRRAAQKPSFTDSAVRAAFRQDALALVELHPSYLALATDINLLALRDINEYVAFASLYKEIYREIKRMAPETHVFVSFQWDALHLMGEREPARGAEHQKLVEIFRPQLDLLAFAGIPSVNAPQVAAIPNDYFSRAADFARSGERVAILQTGWPASMGGEPEQAAYVARLPKLLATLRPSFVAWATLHDLGSDQPMASLGLAQNDGTRRLAFGAFEALSKEAPEVPAAAPPTSHEADHFALFVSDLAGREQRLVLADPSREINHARVSPDREWVTFTRFNRRGADGYATEVGGGYDETEIMRMRLDGSKIEALIPSRRGAVAANSYWTPDGTAIIYIGKDPESKPQLFRLDIATRKVSRVPTPAGLIASDPHQVGNKIAFPVKGRGPDAVWMMGADGTDAHQLSHPPNVGPPREPGPGDYDPKISPDATRVAVMRNLGVDNWHIVVIDIATGQEHDLSASRAVDAMPEWSSDGTRLVFWHVEPKDPARTGLYTMRPDGSERTTVPLKRGYFYTSPAFFPNEGASPEAHIIFSGRRNPKL
jgi:dipeptidyl aminopeptidase/acylaminoacyl peptidase